MQFEDLTTKRLYLRKVTPEVMESVYSGMPEAEQIRFFGLQSKEELLREKQKFKKGLSTFNKTFLYFHIINKNAQDTIGWCGYHTWYTDHDRAEIGYSLYEDKYKGQGIMKEAIAAIVEYGFLEMKLNRIEAFAASYNTPSLKILKRLNFEEEGLLKQHYYYKGKYEDSLVFALLKTDYIKST